MASVSPIRDPKKLSDMQQFLMKKSYRNYMLFSLGVYTALRVSDILKLRVRDIRGRTKFIACEGKTRKRNDIAINPDLKKIIDVGLAKAHPQDFVIQSPIRKNGRKPLSRVQAWRILSDAAREVGIEESIGTHTMRKTFGYHYYMQTGDVATLMKIFNHATQRDTLSYIGITQDTIDDARLNFRIPKNEYKKVKQ